MTRELMLITKEGVSFFADLLGGVLDSHQEARELLLLNIPSILDNQLNGRLVTQFSKEEVKEVVFEMGGSKVPSSNGFLGSFFQSFWDIVGREVVIAVQSFQELKIMPKGVNLTLITLIPKVSKENS